MMMTGNSERGGNRSRTSVASHAAGFTAWLLAAGATLVTSGSVLAQASGGNSAAGVGGGAASVSGRASQPGTTTQSQISMVVNDNGKTIKLELKNDVVTLAEVDGQRIPDSQIERDGDVIRLKDDKGNILFERELGISSTSSDPFAAMSRFSALSALSGMPGNTWLMRNRPGAVTVLGPQDLSTTVTEQVETPKVMVGVQMAEPDSILRGHLGIKEDVSTMVMGVHKGLAAEKAGLAPYDLIVSIDGKDDADPDAIRATLRTKNPGETVKFGVIHQGQRKELTITLDAYDRKRLTETEVDAIAITDSISSNLNYAAAGGPNSLAGISVSPYGNPLSIQEREKLLADIAGQEAAARKMAEDARRKFDESMRQWRGSNASGAVAPLGDGEMKQRMERLEKMIEQLLQEKSKDGKPEESGKDPGSRSLNSNSRYISMSPRV